LSPIAPSSVPSAAATSSSVSPVPVLSPTP
jgi:hypothetical protein